MFFEKSLKIETRKCADCKHILEKKDMQVIEADNPHSLFYNSDVFEESNDEWSKSFYEGRVYYCPMHKKNYDIQNYTRNSKGTLEMIFYKIIPEKRVRVDKNGKRIK